MNDLSVVVVTYNTKELTIKCLEAIYKSKCGFKFETILVDNASSDGTVEEVKKLFKQVKVVVSEKNLGFAGGNNLGLGVAGGKYCLLLNSDAFVKEGALERLVNLAEESQLGITSAKLLNPDGSFQPNGGQPPSLLSNFVWISGLDDLLPGWLGRYSYQMRNLVDYEKKGVGWVSGTAMMISRRVIEKIGLLDEKLFMYGEDVEYCMRANENGFRVGWCRDALVVHLGGASSKQPKLSQWRGEFKGLKYIYLKHLGLGKYIILKSMLYPFILLRIIAFALIGKIDYSTTYAKIITEI